MALRVQQYKIVFAEQLATGLQVWREPLKQMRIPKMFDLRSDPFEAGEDSIKYNDWFVEHVPFQYAAQAVVHAVARELQRVPAATKGGELHGRPDRREADAEIVGPRVMGFRRAGSTSRVGIPSRVARIGRRTSAGKTDVGDYPSSVRWEQLEL